ncbi:STAS domain-containing protein [Mycobacterium sp. 1423905.2]|uniref:STAS domain-containing protein n=1 Tax=Mycobacterium sp. 1423905.2 TaxID=1856859 RepID=UPI0007FD9204|nr:STAS domain-containing protein [Mycobacterium sp. 1423905.2]OBJ63007.1 sulfate transporter [Mycobacterium sp. 1423905.2]
MSSVNHSRLRSGTADFSAQWGPSAGVITANGELDAANADQFADYVQHCAKFCKHIVLDLRGVDFIGTAGFSALHRINVVCSAANAHWAMVPSREVSRLLRVCDPDGALPIAESINDAAEAEPGLLQLIPEPC